jgi:aminopeptidase N
MKFLFKSVIIFLITVFSTAQDMPLDNRHFKKFLFSADDENKQIQNNPWVDSHPEYDVLKYDINISLLPDEQIINARVTIDFVAVEDIDDNLVFDFAGLAIDSVFWDNRRVSATRQNETLQIPVPLFIMAGDTHSVQIYYQGKPQKGLYFRSNGQGDTVIYTHNEPYDAHFWFPCKDDPSDKAKLEMKITVPGPLIVLSNGKLIGQSFSGSGYTLFSWKEDYPIATYLVSLAAGHYTVVDKIFPWSTVDLLLQYYVYPEDVERGESALESTAEMMDFYSDYIGEYPFISEKYSMVEVPMREAAAMENQTATTMGDFVMDNQGVIAHELAHQWWGDALTPSFFKDIWLNEGFASYFDALFTEFKDGKESFKTKMDNFRNRITTDGSLLYPIYNPPLRYLFGNAVYYKGAWVLHMLRAKMGDETFREICRRYYEDFRYKNVTTADFIHTAELISGCTLLDFFNQWLEYGGLPVIIGSWNQINGTVELSLQQDQEEPVYRFDLDVLIKGVSTDTLLEIPVTERFVRQRISFAEPVAGIVIDPDKKILNTNNSPLYLIPKRSRLVRLFPNPFNERVTISYQLSRREKVSITIYNLLGEKVALLVDDEKNIGIYTIDWSGLSAATGAYYCVMKTKEDLDIRKMVLLK